MTMLTVNPALHRQQQPLMAGRAPKKQPPKVQFGGNTPKFGETDAVSIVKKIAKWSMPAVGAFTALFGIFDSYSVNPKSTRSIVFHEYGGGTPRNADGSCVIQGEGLVVRTPFITTNYQYGTDTVKLADSYQPVARDGVVVNGDGRVDQGVDVELAFKLDRGPVENGEAKDPTLLARNICRLHDVVIGSSDYNERFTNDEVNQNRAGGDKPATPQHSVRFDSGQPEMQRLYFSQILPRIQRSLRILAKEVNAEDMNSQREFLRNGIEHGHTIYERDNQGRVRMQDGKPVVRVQIPSLRDELRDIGLELEYFTINKIDLPGILAEPIRARASLPQETTNYGQLRQQYIEQQDAARTAAQSENNKALEGARGEANQDIARAQGQLNQAMEDAKKTVAEAEGRRAARIAAADGERRSNILKAQSEAAGFLQEGRRQRSIAENGARATAQSLINVAEADAQAQRLRGEMYERFPALFDKLVSETNGEIRAALAARMGLTLVAPDTALDGSIMQLGTERFRVQPPATEAPQR